MSRVLVVEDSADQARLIAGLLHAADLEVELAAGGRQAIERMRVDLPDVVVTDLIMPEMDGLALVEEVRRQYPCVPVILMTAFGSGGIARRALEHGAASYVPKRQLLDELVPTITDLLAVVAARREQAQIARQLERSEHDFALASDVALVPGVVAFVQELLRRQSEVESDTLLMQVGVALHEALVNAMHHGNLEVGSELRDAGGDAYRDLVERRRASEPYRDRRVHVSVRLTRDELSCVIRDEGPGFDPAQIPDPTSPDQLERVSGRGLYLIWAFMDAVRHNASGNEITLVKRLIEPEPMR